MLFSNKRERTISTCNNLDKSLGIYTERKEPVSKGYILYDSIYIWSGNEKKIEIKKQISDFQGLGIWEGSRKWCDYKG